MITKGNTHNGLALKYVLFEDEQLSRLYFEKAISQMRPAYCKSGEGSSVACIEKVLATTNPDFIISGICLSDGLSTNEYKRLRCNLPTIFFTSYKTLLPGADGLNVVHYALKPVTEDDLKLAIGKIEQTILEK